MTEASRAPPDETSGKNKQRDGGLLSRVRSWIEAAIAAPAIGQLASGVAWNVGAVATERIIGLLQALYVARLLGIEEFGKYGLVFVTIGLLSSLVGLQLGLTVAVQLARARQKHPERAAAVMRLCEMTSLVLGCTCFLLVAVFPEEAARQLLGDSKQADVVLAGAAIAALSVVSGVQEGVLQGFERFRNLAILRVGAAVFSFAMLLLLAKSGDLSSVIFALTLGVFARTIALFAIKEFDVRRAGMETQLSSIWQARSVLFTFSLPAVLGSLIAGFSNWYGFVLVSKLPGGFDEVAVLTAGQQWRGLALYLTTISAGVAIPIMSRLGGSGDATGIRQVHGVSLLVNVGAAIAFVAGLWLVAGIVLSFYGTAFVDGRLVFWAMVATTVPMVFANVYFQYLVSQGRMWEQFGFYALQAVPLIIGYLFFVERYGAIGFAAWTGIVGVGLCIILAWRVRVGADRGMGERGESA